MSEPITIEEVRALREAATPGPWDEPCGCVVTSADGAFISDSFCDAMGDYAAEREGNAALIAAAPRIADLVIAQAEEIERLRPIVDDLRALVREVDRPPGGMRVPWFHDLAGAARVPSVVSWARRAISALDTRDPRWEAARPHDERRGT